MAKKLYVGGLPYSTTDDELREAFTKAGAVASVTILMDKMTGRSRGFGFVEMENDEDAAKAIDMWNGQDFGGRKLTVNEAKPMEPRAPARTMAAVTVLVLVVETAAAGNLAFNTTKNSLASAGDFLFIGGRKGSAIQRDFKLTVALNGASLS